MFAFILASGYPCIAFDVEWPPRCTVVSDAPDPSQTEALLMPPRSRAVPRQRVLVVNDDGIDAPGLRAVVVARLLRWRRLPDLRATAVGKGRAGGGSNPASSDEQGGQ